MANKKPFISSKKPPTRRLIVYVIGMLIMQSLTIFGAFYILDSLPESISPASASEEDIYRYAFRGPVNIIKTSLSAPNKDPSESLKEIQSYFAYPVTLMPKDLTLSRSVKKQFKTDDLAFDDEQYLFYAKLSNNPSQILVIGPVINPAVIEGNDRALLILALLWTVFSFVMTLAFLHIVLYPLWKDAMSIRETAEELSCGNLQARAPTVIKTWLFRPLATVLNDMATQIEHLFFNSKVTLHAMAHELRTPIARLRFALSILDESKTKQEYCDYRKDIDHDIEELESLINLSLGLFKMQQNGVVLNRELVSLYEWGEELCNNIESFKPENFELTYSAHDSVANIDSKIIALAITNLLLNAFKYASSRVQLTISQENGITRIEVDDDGPGIPKESREKVFVPFSRLDNSRTKTTGGHGLGLAYVKLIAELHCGSVRVTDSTLGGCKFILSLDENKTELDQ